MHIKFALAHFPNEIFPHIFEHLDNYHLYLICILSKRFNELALRAVISRIHGLDISSGVFNVHSDAVIFLRLAFFIPRIRTLRCSLKEGYTLPHLRQLKYLASRQPIIDRLELDLGCNLLDTKHSTRVEEIRLFCEVLCTIAGDAHPVFVITPAGSTFTCRSKGIVYWELENYRYGKEEHTTIGRFSRFLSTGRLNFGYPFMASIQSHTGTYEAVDVIDDLRMLLVHRIRTPLHAFTVASLSPSTPRLSLDRQCHLSSEEWAAVLECLALGSLSSLHIRDAKIRSADIHLFLLRHPEITTLYMGDTRHPSSIRLPLSGSLSLTSVDAHPHHIPDLFESGNTLPYLSNICMSLCFNKRKRCFSFLDQALLSIARHQTTDLHLNFNLDIIHSHRREFHRWLNYEDRDDRIESRLYCVKILRFGGSMSGIGDLDLHFFPRWLSLFPELQELYFNFTNGERVRIRNTFLRSVSALCPRVQVVEIGFGNRRTMDSWLADADNDEEF